MQNAKIKVLPDDIICRIAAGEVVERPASVVKELIENSIDARATRIEIEIKDGGQKLIEITDNGEGMCRQDAVLAFTPHATSKIIDDSELEHVISLGFRGEALPTIASVARVSMVTRHESEETGSRVTIDGGRIVSVDSDSFPKGTRIQVKNLFYNVPARRKFLKSIQAEMAQISDVVCHYMMGYPEIAFKFSKNNVQIAATNGSGNLIDAILAVYGPEVTRSLVQLKEPVSIAGTGMSLRGYISPPNQARPAARYMTTLVNRRVVKPKLLTQAVNKACGAFFPRGRYPVLILDLRVPPEIIDVNVHPQKTEIRFKDERWVFATIWETIQSSLSGLRMVSEPVRPAEQTRFEPETADLPDYESADSRPGDLSRPAAGSIFTPPPPFSMPGIPAQSGIGKGETKLYELKDTEMERLGPHSAPQIPAGATAFAPVVTLHRPKILAQLKNSYLLGEDDDGLFIIDQHAAHERILFDQFVNTYKDTPVTAQPLLFPVPLKLLPSERLIIKEQLPQLKTLGFSIHQEDDNQFYVTAVPVSEKKTSDSESIQNVLSEVLNGWESRSISEIKTDLLKMMACKAAVKAGDPLTDSEWSSLLEQLLKTENPFTCPHGRPIVIRLTTRQIETGFLRT
ncbi:MAG: DNA mismatch repair endonuclease MutL [Candidatus Riflebacteria bacterium]|nr:DNA mismatch repair endonuclease MutL [Candidatus Riflebacteria bacterium]